MEDLVPIVPPAVNGDPIGKAAGEALWRLTDTRKRTLAALREVDVAWIDRCPPRGRNTIGTLMYHIAAVELDWLFSDLLDQSFPDGFRQWFPDDVRDEAGNLAARCDEKLEHHVARMVWVRDRATPLLATIDDDEFARSRTIDGRAIAPLWIVQHLSQHEAEHRGQIQALITAFGGPESG